MAGVGGGSGDAVTELQPEGKQKPAAYPRQQNFGVVQPVNSGIAGAAACGTVEEVRNAFEADKTSIDSAGPDGLTALQVACRDGRQDVVKTLLELGADVNARGARNRTAFLIACQVGHVSIVHLLFEKDCDVDVQDEDGRSCMHYAAVSPSPTIIHYLQYVADITLLCVDKHKSTPLHIAARHPKFSETLDYLLDQNVYDVFDRDKLGSTPVHYAAQAGNAHNCYRLICAANDKRSELLRVEDRNGNTPVMLARKAKRSGKTFAIDLIAWGKYGVYHAWFHWWSHLLFTPISMTLIIVALSKLPDYLTFFIAILSPLLFVRAFRNLTRMPHVSRWRSPLMFGTFLSGIVHSIVCYYWKIFPVQQAHEGWSVAIVYNAFVILTSVYILWTIMRTDPGVCKDPSLKKDGTPYGLEDVAGDAEQGPSRLMFCARCSIVPPAVTKHCRLCDVCIEDFDHHCLWLNRCIGYLNIRLFVLLLMNVAVANISFCVAAVRYLRYQDRPMHNFVELFQLFSGSEPWVCWLLALNIMALLIVLKLLIEKIVVVSAGCTSYFDQNGQRYAGYGSLLQDLNIRNKPAPVPLAQRFKNTLVFFTTKPARRIRKPTFAT